VDVSAATPAPAASPANRRRRATGTLGQVVGVAGIVVSLLLIVLVILGRGWAVEQIDAVATTVDGAIAKAMPMVDNAQGKVSDVEDRVAEVAGAAEVIAANPNATPQLLQGVLQRLNDLSATYLELRDGYSGFREQVMTALSRLQTIDRLIPGIDIPEGPVDAIATLDERIQSLDATVMEVINAAQNLDAINTAAATIAEKARAVETLLGDVSGALARVETGLTNLQADIDSTAATITTIVTAVSVLLVLLLLYIVLLHIVLFRSSRGYTRGPAEA
jgi:methyl-accepting chemotaxis protein